MFRLIALLALLPTIVAADWSPRPLMFSYEATFANCIADPTSPDLSANCYDSLAAAYALKRAVAYAAVACGDETFDTCSIPFEEEGLPAFASSIAHDTGCDATHLTQLGDDEPLPQEHCVTITADILNDEGAVPLYADIGCGIDWIECGELAQINAQFWIDQVDLAAPDDAIARDLLERNSQECADEARDMGGWATELNATECEADRAAALWADLAEDQEN